MYIGIDIGGTNTRVVATESLESPSIEDQIKFPTYPSFDENFERITSFIDSTQKEIDGIGIGIAGDVNTETGLMSNPHNIFQFVNIPIAKMLSDKYRCKAKIENDAVAASLGETYFGNKLNNFTYITWGTGTNVIAVDLLAKPKASEINRKQFFSDWEETFSGGYIFRKFKKKPEEINDKEWQSIIMQFYKKLDLFLQETKTKHIVFGGGIAIKKWNLIEKTISDLTEKYDVKLELTKLGENVGLYGALALLK